MEALAGRNQPGLRSRCIPVMGIIWASICLSGCLTDGKGSEAGTEVVANPSETLPPNTTPERTVCDPFNVGTTARDRGLVGNLLYLTDDQPRYTDVGSYIDNGVPVASTLYFDKLFIPTRAFDLGFYTQTGTLLLNPNNQPIYEYFALRLESQLTLAAGELPGWYQMSVLSDDGSRVSLKNTDGSLTTLVDNDGTHSTRMGCAINSIYLDANSKIPVVVEYYQGPRYHIAMTLMWRPLPTGIDPHVAVTDAECGRSGNTRYFDSSTVPSTPTAIYYDLLTRGWKPLSNDNYSFPVQASNPCAVAAPLLMTNFAINTSTRTSVTVSWVTSLAASSQVQVKNVTTGQILTSSLDPALTTNHSMTMTGLTANTLYAVKALSTASAGQTAFSDELAFRTPR